MKQTPEVYLLARRLMLPLLAIFSFLAVLFPLTNTDIWWHLAAGREIVRMGTIPRNDPFSISSLGNSWTDLHWLFQVVVYFLWRLGGVASLVIGKCVVFSIAAVVLLKAAEAHLRTDSGISSRALRPLAVAVLALLIFAGREFVFMRPVVFSLFYMSLFLYLIGRYLNERRVRYLAALVVVQVLWANSQPLFPLGPLMVACYLAGEGLCLLARRLELPGFSRGLPARALVPLAVTLLLLVAASLATPFGIDGLVLPFKLFFRLGPDASNLFGYNVSENVPPWLLGRAGDGSIAAFAWVLGTALGSFLLIVKRISLSRLFLLGAMLLPALLANRNLLLFYWVAGPVILANVGAAVHRAHRAEGKRFFRRLLENPLLAGLVVAIIAVPLGFSLNAQSPLVAPAPFRVPVEASDVIEELPARGNIFNSVRYGGYLIWKLFPERRPFIDGRLVLRTGKQFSDYLDLLDHPEGFSEYARRHDLRTAVLPVAMPDRYRPLVGALSRDPNWDLVFTDGTQTVFTRGNGDLDPIDLSDRQVPARIAASLSRRFSNDPPAEERAIINLGLLLVASGNYEQAAKILADHKSRMARALFSRSLFLGGHTLEALKISQALLEKDPDDVDSLLLASQIMHESGKLDDALDLAERALNADPYNREARLLLDDIRRAAAKSVEPQKRSEH